MGSTINVFIQVHVENFSNFKTSNHLWLGEFRFKRKRTKQHKLQAPRKKQIYTREILQQTKKADDYQSLNMKDREAKLFVNYIDILIESSPKTGIKKTSKSLGINFKPIGLRDIAYTEYDSTCSEKCATVIETLKNSID